MGAVVGAEDPRMITRPCQAAVLGRIVVEDSHHIYSHGCYAGMYGTKEFLDDPVSKSLDFIVQMV